MSLKQLTVQKFFLIGISTISLSTYAGVDFICEGFLAQRAMRSDRNETRAIDIIQKWKLPANSLAADLIHLIQDGKIASQNDPRLTAVSSVGLCNATCVAAVVVAQANGYSLTKASALPHVDQIIKTARELAIQMNRNEVGGSNNFDGKIYLKALMADGALPDSLEMRELHGASNVESIFFEPGEISYTNVRDQNGGHAIIFVAIDRKTSSVLVYDPNFPSQLFDLSYYIEERPKGVMLADLPTMWGDAKIGASIKIRRGNLRTLTPDMRERLAR